MNSYEVEPEFQKVNSVLRCRLGNAVIEGMKTYWDVSLGKIKSDASVLSIVLQDNDGNYYWHRSLAFEGDIYDQCRQVKEAVKKFHIPNVQVETSGVGGFVPSVLRKELNGTGCSITEVTPRDNKNKRILEAIETPLSGSMIWCHESIVNSPAWDQMLEWKPEVVNQPDDYLDSFSGAILSAPIRMNNKPITTLGDVFKPNGQIYEATWSA